MRDILAERGIVLPKKNASGVRDILAERGINLPKKQSQKPNENQMLGENIQARHPRIANFLGKLADTDVGRATEFFGQGAKPVNEFMERSGIPEFAGAGLSHAMNVPISVINTPSYIGEQITGQKLPQLPYSDLNKAFRPEQSKTTAGQIGSGAGGFVGDLLGGGAVLKLLSRGSQAVNALHPRNIGFLENALKGGGAGYAMAGEENNRELGAGLGFAIPSIIKAGGKVLEPYMNLRKNIKTGELPVEQVAPLVKNMRKSHMSDFQNTFGDILEKAEEGGLKHIIEPRRNPAASMKMRQPKPHNPYKLQGLNPTQELSQEMTRKVKKPTTILQRFKADPTPELGHRLQSDLGKRIYKLKQKENLPGGMLDPDKRKLQRLEKARKTVLSKLTTGLEKASPGLGKKYRNTLKDYGVVMGPYLDSKAFQKILAGKSGDKKFLNRLIKEEDFMHRAGRAIPELKHRENLPEYLKRHKNIRNAAIGTPAVLGALGGLNSGYNALFGGGHE
jgi:hypothetical protein